MEKQHHYVATIQWTGNQGSGTKDYKSYSRDHIILVNNKVEIKASSDPAFRGDPSRHNPEELLVASISACHMLWYLHLCTEAGVIVTTYADKAEGIMNETTTGKGYFSEVVLNPIVTVTDQKMIATANALHKEANAFCFIANSVNFQVHHKPTCFVKNVQAKGFA